MHECEVLTPPWPAIHAAARAPTPTHTLIITYLCPSAWLSDPMYVCACVCVTTQKLPPLDATELQQFHAIEAGLRSMVTTARTVEQMNKVCVTGSAHAAYAGQHMQGVARTATRAEPETQLGCKQCARGLTLALVCAYVCLFHSQCHTMFSCLMSSGLF